MLVLSSAVTKLAYSANLFEAGIGFRASYLSRYCCRHAYKDLLRWGERSEYDWRARVSPTATAEKNAQPQGCKPSMAACWQQRTAGVHPARLS